MQSGGGSGRNPGVGRAVTSSAAASPTSSSSASQLGLDSMQQQQQQQQMGSRQVWILGFSEFSWILWRTCYCDE